MAGIPGHRVVVFLQENKTTDFYFPTMGAWGAAVRARAILLPAPPNHDQPHDRNAWVHYAAGDYPALDAQIDNDTVIPYYSWLAKQFVFSDHHFGSGSNSTPGHMLAIGGQMPTMRNPPFAGAHPVWDIPSVFTAADAAGVTYAAFPDQSGYPTKFYASLGRAPGSEHVHPPKDFLPMAASGELPQVCYVWSPAGYDEHPPFVSDPTYVTKARTSSGTACRPLSTPASGTPQHSSSRGTTGAATSTPCARPPWRPFRTLCIRAGSRPSVAHASRC